MNNQQKYQNIINWWNAKLAEFFPPPQTLHPELHTPEFVTEAKRLVTNG